MAAIDPNDAPEADEEGNVPEVHRSTVRLIKRAFPGLDDDEDDEIDDEYMKALLAGSDDDEDDEDEDDEEANGGPSDPAKSKKQKQAAAIKKLLEATQGEDEDMEDAKPNGVKAKGKGKGKVAEEEEEEDEEDEDEDEDEYDSDEDSDDGADLENFVVCTLDTERVSLLLQHAPTVVAALLTQRVCRTTSNLLISP